MSDDLARVGVLVVGHAPLAGALHAAAAHVVGTRGAHVAVVDVEAAESPDAAQRRIATRLSELDAGHGVLVLVDIAGATPANAALAAADGLAGVACVAPASLAMLLRVYNYADATLTALVEIAVETGARHTVCLTPRETGEADR
ncbi:PTS sugar transporter subunit IIA [Salinisphaera sp. Q1T1-3]|uniref:PTS sugar transporter subunit IIA n=1 Tax=Salinisphaera sp. Q1T1-3 TaxID=2321229 RepID=UPI000E72C82A|nr:hypothetical protein [Salinisphaera sp. Q1T1-3]RJS92252.1 hypothetical protein D3260_12765 [Salinisphaera sp. Q1T1-3]